MAEAWTLGAVLTAGADRLREKSLEVIMLTLADDGSKMKKRHRAGLNDLRVHGLAERAAGDLLVAAAELTFLACDAMAGKATRLPERLERCIEAAVKARASLLPLAEALGVKADPVDDLLAGLAELGKGGGDG